MAEMTDAEREAVWEKRRQKAIREHNEYVRKLEEVGKKLARSLARVTGSDLLARIRDCVKPGCPSLLPEATWNKCISMTQKSVLTPQKLADRAIASEKVEATDENDSSGSSIIALAKRSAVPWQLLREMFCPICLGPDGPEVKGCKWSAMPGACNISYIGCSGLAPIGTFHTHPIGFPIPSTDDLSCAKNRTPPERIFVIGGRVGNEIVVRAFMPKSEYPGNDMGEFYSHLHRSMTDWKHERNPNWHPGPFVPERLLPLFPMPSRKISVHLPGVENYNFLNLPSDDDIAKYDAAAAELAKRWFRIEERRVPLEK